MKKTLIITLEYPPKVGGIATYVHQMAEAFDPEKTVVYAPKMLGTEEWDNTVKYKVIRKKPYFSYFWPRWLKMFFQIKKIVKEEKIEVIILHHVLPVAYVAKMIKKIFKIPFIVCFHGTDFVFAMKNNWKKRRTLGVLKTADLLVFNSESLKRRFAEKVEGFSEKSIVLYPCPSFEMLNAPEPEVLTNIKKNFALEGKKVVLTISRFDEGKGLPHLAMVMKEVVEKRPNIVWMIIGDGKKKDELMDYIQKNKMQNVVRYLGEIPHKDLKQYYYSADLFALLTHPDKVREEEGLGMVFLEAQACGIPVIAGRSGGVEEAVLNGHTGLVFEVYQEKLAIEKAILNLLENKEYAGRLAENGKQRIISDFKWKNQLAKLDIILKN
ncbi:MAG: glycosyltransferase family 4 protein [Patescibacteria group bacterium]